MLPILISQALAKAEYLHDQWNIDLIKGIANDRKKYGKITTAQEEYLQNYITQ